MAESPMAVFSKSTIARHVASGSFRREIAEPD
jgi:hypothetical protein